jgi:hypothetical protein
LFFVFSVNSVVKNELPRQVVLLGASNLTLSLGRIVGALQSGWNEELHLLAAHGHGRSYGKWSRVLLRSLPGIVECDLWAGLEQRPTAEAPLSALVTDVGNDLIYGSTPDQIAGWVEQCLERLAARRAEIVLTLLPMESVQRLSAWRYHLTRMCFFPGSGPAWPIMQERAADLNERLRNLAAAYGAHVVDPPGEWYGFDPIHVRRGRRDEAWNTVFSGWQSFDAVRNGVAISLAQALRLIAGRPAERRFLGRGQHCTQPSQRVGNVRVSIY